MKSLTFDNIAGACRGSYYGPEAGRSVCVDSVETDSRKVGPGALFVALKGSRADGHSFIQAVMEAGAAGVLVEERPDDPSVPCVLVESTLQAVKDLAEFYLSELGIPVIGITGSVGKTSTKEMTASVLSQKYKVLKTAGNFNNELGLPLTIFRLREGDEMAVLEMGISDFGEMHRLAKVARPDTCMITNIGMCHLEKLGDRDGVLRAKTEIFDFLGAAGQIVLNGDDDKLSSIRQVRGIRPVTYGLEEGFDFWADDLRPEGLDGISARIHSPLGAFEVLIPMPGRYMVYNALAAAAVGYLYGLSLRQIQAGIEQSQSLSGRFHILKTGRLTVIDDCYNANPVSMRASLEVLQSGKGRRVAILGDMGELGEDEQFFHADLGRFAGGLDLDAIYGVGPLSQELCRAAKEENPGREVRHFVSKSDLLAALPALLEEGDSVLVKASHFMGFEEVVDRLRAV